MLFPGFQQLDIAGPMAAFEVAELERPGSYAWRLVASQAGAVRSSAGVAWPVQALPRDLTTIDMVMVIGGDGANSKPITLGFTCSPTASMCASRPSSRASIRSLRSGPAPA